MNKEEKEAIERFSKAFEYLNVWNKELIVVPEDKKYFLTVLNLLEKKDKEIAKFKNNNKDLLRKLRNRVKEVKKLEKYSTYKQEFSTLNKQLQKKDKQIEQYQNILATNDMLHVRECEKKDKWINRLETKLMYALTPTKHELAKRTQEEFKEIIRENIDEDTYTIKRKLKENWNNL